MKTIILALIIIFSTSFFITCGDKKNTQKIDNNIAVTNEPYSLDDSMWVQLDYNLYDSTFADSLRQLSIGEISLAEAIIFEQIKNEAPNIYKKRKLYKRQYFCGFKNKQILIYINFFIDEAGQFDDWKSEYIVVFDGGDNFFQIKINWTEMKCYDLSLNGDA